MKTTVILIVAVLYSARAVPLECPPCYDVPTDCELSLPPVKDSSDYPCACPKCKTTITSASLKAYGHAADTICEIKGQVYSECGSACPSTCGDPEAADFCTDVCVKGCQCPSGTVLDEVTYQCVELNQCTCPQDCSKDYCTRPGNERALCNIPGHTDCPSGCTGQCQLTHCSACYYDDRERFLPMDICEDCGSPVSSPSCLRTWANCVGVRDQQHYGKPDPSSIIQEKFKCYKYPCKLRRV